MKNAKPENEPILKKARKGKSTQILQNMVQSNKQQLQYGPTQDEEEEEGSDSQLVEDDFDDEEGDQDDDVELVKDEKRRENQLYESLMNYNSTQEKNELNQRTPRNGKQKTSQQNRLTDKGNQSNSSTIVQNVQDAANR